MKPYGVTTVRIVSSRQFEWEVRNKKVFDTCSTITKPDVTLTGIHAYLHSLPLFKGGCVNICAKTSFPDDIYSQRNHFEEAIFWGLWIHKCIWSPNPAIQGKMFLVLMLSMLFKKSMQKIKWKGFSTLNKCDFSLGKLLWQVNMHNLHYLPI